MQENSDGSILKCPVCGNPDTVAVFAQHLGIPDAKQALIAYRCSDGHVFLPPHRE